MKNSEPTLRLSIPWTEQLESEVQAKGRCWFATAVMPNGDEYPVCFFTAGHVSWEVETEDPSEFVVVAEPGLIVIREITLENMERALRAAWVDGFFQHLRPLKSTSQ